MKITVTRDHAVRGKQGDCNLCPIALACLEQIRGAELVRVGDEIPGAMGSTIVLVNGVDLYVLPMEITRIIHNYDVDEEGGEGYMVGLTPLTFEMEAYKDQEGS